MKARRPAPRRPEFTEGPEDPSSPLQYYSLVPEPPKDPVARGLHFVIGLLAGLGHGFVLAWWWQVRDATEFFLILAVFAIGFGLAARRWGDRFWNWLYNIGPWRSPRGSGWSNWPR